MRRGHLFVRSSYCHCCCCCLRCCRRCVNGLIASHIEESTPHAERLLLVSMSTFICSSLNADCARSHRVSAWMEQEGVRFALDPEGERLLFLEGMREYSSKVTPRHKKILANFFDQEVSALAAVFVILPKALRALMIARVRVQCTAAFHANRFRR